MIKKRRDPPPPLPPPQKKKMDCRGAAYSKGKYSSIQEWCCLITGYIHCNKLFYYFGFLRYCTLGNVHGFGGNDGQREMW